MSRMMEFRIRWGLFALLAAALALVLPPPSPVYAGGGLLNRNSVGGILVKPNGLVERATVEERAEILQRMRRDTPKASPEMNLPVELRKVSLRGLEAALANAVADSIENDIAAGNSWQVILKEDGKVEWITVVDGVVTAETDTEPMTTATRRAEAKALAIVPDDAQL